MWGCERSLPRGRGQGLGPGHAGTFCVQRRNPAPPPPAPANVSHSTGLLPTFSLCASLGLNDQPGRVPKDTFSM